MAMVDALLPEFDHEMTTTRKLLERVPDPTAQQVREALDRHLCRCGMQQRMVAAVLDAARALRDGAAASIA